jgi:hypothetical protein
MGKVQFRAFLTDSPDRKFLNDGPLPTSVAPSGGRGPTNRKLIASFPGTSFVAEREEGELRVYLVSDVALPTNLTGDAKPHCGCGTSMDAGRMTAARLQERSLQLRASGR